MTSFQDWRASAKPTETMIVGAEHMLDHQGLLKLREFAGSQRNATALVDETHPDCARFLSELPFLSQVVLCKSAEVQEAVLLCRPANILINQNGTPLPGLDEAIRACGATAEWRSTQTSDFIDVLPRGMRTFLHQLAKTHTCASIIKSMEAFKSLKILVVGEAIIDEYIFCSAINKSNKEPIIASQFERSEKYAGGSVAIANHLAGFSDHVRLLTRLGAENSHREFIESKLLPNVSPNFLERSESPTILKQRIVESHLARKMFELYYHNPKPPTEAEDAAFLAALEDELPHADLVVVADYGHDLMTDAAIRLLCANAKFLAVNTQTNAGNKGFNLVSKYPRADFVSIDTPEAQLECRNKHLPVPDLLQLIASRIDCPRVTITMGKQGNYCLCDGRLLQIPVLSLKVIDAIGAGDAFLSLAACAAAKGFSPELTGFIGNIAGAEACAMIGNSGSVSFSGMRDHIQGLWRIAGLEK